MSDNYSTGEVRLSFVHLAQPWAGNDGNQEPKYSVTLLIPKSDQQTIQGILRLIDQAKQEGMNNQWKGAIPPQLKIPMYDGDGVRPNGDPFGEECRGCMVLTAGNKLQPFVVDENLQAIMNPAQIYSGMYGQVSLRFFAYNSNGNRGVGCSLNGVKKTRDGEALSGGISAEEAFGRPQNAAPQIQGQMVYQQPQYQQPQYQQPQYQQPQYQTPAQYQQPQYQQPVDPVTGGPYVGQVLGV